MLPTPYCKEAQPFEHYDHPEELARARVRADIESGWSEHRQTHSGHSWYGHGTEIRGDKIIVTQCAGKEMFEVFNYKQLVLEEKQKMRQQTLFA